MRSITCVTLFITILCFMDLSCTPSPKTSFQLNVTNNGDSEVFVRVHPSYLTCNFADTTVAGHAQLSQKVQCKADNKPDDIYENLKVTITRDLGYLPPFFRGNLGQWLVNDNFDAGSQPPLEAENRPDTIVIAMEFAGREGRDTQSVKKDSPGQDSVVKFGADEFRLNCSTRLDQPLMCELKPANDSTKLYFGVDSNLITKKPDEFIIWDKYTLIPAQNIKNEPNTYRETFSSGGDIDIHCDHDKCNKK